MVDNIKTNASEATDTFGWEDLTDKIGDFDFSPLYNAVSSHEGELRADVLNMDAVDQVIHVGIDVLIEATTTVNTKLQGGEDIGASDLDAAFDWYAEYGGGYNTELDDNGDMIGWQAPNNITDANGNRIENPTGEDVKHFFDVDGDGVLSESEAETFLSALDSRVEASSTFSAQEMMELQYRMSNFTNIILIITETMRNLLDQYKQGYANAR